MADPIQPIIPTYQREALPSDGPLLRQLFEESVATPASLIGPQAAFLNDMQFRGREMSYTAQFPDAENHILCLADGTPAGRCFTARQPGALRVIDIAVLRAYRGRGIATSALQTLQRTAAAEIRNLCLRVSRDSPALRLYERLGFSCIASDELSFEMAWRPS